MGTAPLGSQNPFQPKDSGTDNPAAAGSPFAEPAKPPEEPPALAEDSFSRREIESIPSSMWTVAGYLLLLTLLVLSGYSLLHQKRVNDELLGEITQRDSQINKLKYTALQKDTALQEAAQGIAELKDEMAELKHAKEAAAGAQSALESQMRAALESKDIAISELQGKLTLSILDRILFDSGQAEIKPEGQEVLRKVAAVLDQYPNRQIQVNGHTDNVPIHTSQFPTNWELSAARALAAVRFLVEQAGVDPKRLAAVANGEFQPVADNSTPEGRAKNRRIAIIVLPEVFNPAEQKPPAPVRKETNPAPGS
jgi:flagellar motor protein MotB